MINWSEQKKPIFGLSPMDGVTDAAFRYMVDTYSKPDVLLTEFVPVEAIAHGAEKVLHSFVYHQTETPTIAQIYGTDLIAYYKATFVACEAGFDGVDINMGCPDKTITKRGAGAGLILQPKHAQEIIKTVKTAIKDWSEGKTIEEAEVAESIINWVQTFKKTHNIITTRQILPVSVKTRIGVEVPVTEAWIANLLEMEPVAITLHGRTLAQMYTGRADWDEIGKAAELAHKTKTILLGNGDIQSMPEARDRINDYNVDGVLIGRATFGNPWFFKEHEATTAERFEATYKHVESFTRLLPDGHFISLRKHMAWYCKNIPHAAEVRAQLMQMNSLDDVRRILAPYTAQT
ncbi:MAG: tRNA dihydrouridine synthase [Weeksellaceae bacterium]